MDEPKDMTSGEEKELRRVFDRLANYLPKSKVYGELNPKREHVSKIKAHKKSPEAIKISHPTTGKTLSEDEVDELHSRLAEEIVGLEKKIQEFDLDPSRKINRDDLSCALSDLGKKSTKKEIEDMIWEVDENLDCCVDWEEFRLMFTRNITDTTGLEPFQLFNVVQFMMYDKDNSGKVTVDETMHMLYARYGKDKLESQMKALFGDDLKTSDGDGELSFGEYLKAVNVRIPRSKKKMKGKR